jgi:FkbM family methyltransferase
MPARTLKDRVYWALEPARRRAFEAAGSARYSRRAAHGLDSKLEQYLPSTPGFFVEAGATDGLQNSNTYYLEAIKGWRGVLVEGIPEQAEACRRNRRRSQVFNCALVGPDFGASEVTMHYSHLMSVVEGAFGSTEAEREHVEKGAASQDGVVPYEVSVPARTLTSVLDEAGAGAIDFLSLDVEGFELEALRGLDLTRFAPALLLIEVLDEERRGAIEAVLGERYELVDTLTEHDSLYRRS